MVNQGTIYRQLRSRFGHERARRISTFAGATAQILSDSILNHFERHDVLPGLAAVFGSQLFDAQQSIALNSEGQEEREADSRYNDLTNLDEVNEIIALTSAPDPNPPAPQPSLAELLGLAHRDGDAINMEAEELAASTGSALAPEGRA